MATSISVTSHSQLQALVRLSYTIYDFSSYSGDFVPNHVLEDRPFDQKSRWLSDGNKPPQFVTLKLLKPAIVSKIVFGKYEKSHPCNIRKFKVFGGLDDQHNHLLLESGLNNDDVSEILDLQCAVNGQPFPCQLIKIVPLQSWGGSFNFSIWHVQLWGVAESSQVENALAKLMQFKEAEAIRLCLKHFRQNDYPEAFEALQKRSRILLEDPILTQLHEELATRGAFDEAESTLKKAAEGGFFDSYISRQTIKARWVPYRCCAGEQLPDMRGGHQMCVGSEPGQLFLYGGWDGSKELGDLWLFDVTTKHWTCASVDSSQQGGPGAKSCHAMCCLGSVLYLLGGYREVTPVSGQQDSLPCEFYSYSTDSKEWCMLSSDTHKEGGPHMIYDHQMCCDGESGLLYVLGGRMVGTELCSGLYAYHTAEKHWLCLIPDQSSTTVSDKPPYFPRSGHVMLFHPGLHELFVIGGHRQKDILSDMLTYDVRSGETSVLYNGSDTAIPLADMTLRGAIDLNHNMICLSASSKQEELDIKGSNSLWLYSISSAHWLRVSRHEKMNEFPVSRYAHSFVYDLCCDCYYMFGGNPDKGNVHGKIASTMRLDDFWTLQLIKQSRESLLKECHFSLRKQKYIELSMVNPVEAILYLQTSVAALIDHSDPTDSRQYRELTSALFTCCPGSLQKMRSDLFDTISSYFPDNMAQPTDNLIDFIRLK